MDIIEVLFLLILGHFVADYALQSDFIAKGKNRWRKVDASSVPPGQKMQTVWPWVLTSHAATHSAAVYLVTQSLALAALEMVAHWAIDYAKCGNKFGIHMDQSLHIACKVAWCVLIVVGLS